MKVILILGVSGFIGSHLAEKLLDNYKVVGFDMRIPDIKDHPNFQFVTGRFTESTDFESLITEYNVSYIYHCISTTTPREGTQHITDEINGNILPTISLLNAATKCEVERMIFLSSGGTVYGESNEQVPHVETDTLVPICSYGVTKVAIENYMQLFKHSKGLDTIITRLSNPYGVCSVNGRTQGIIPIFLERLYNDQPISLYGNTVRDYIYIDDVVDALCGLLTYDGEYRVFNIGSGVGVCLDELILKLEELTGRSFTDIQRLPIRSCDVSYSVIDSSLIKKELDWTPRIDLDKGIEKILLQIKN